MLWGLIIMVDTTTPKAAKAAAIAAKAAAVTGS